MKNILFATSEAVPFIKTGGLADVAGSLPKYFDKRYFDIRVILPKYACMKQEWKDKMNYITHFYMDLGYKNCYVGIMHMEYEGIQFYFIDNEYYFSGPKPYDGGTWDLEKFAFFSKAVLSVLPVIGFRPDIIHCHDWQTGLVPVYLHDSFQQNEFFWNIKTIMTIHNLKFQGVWDVQTIKNITGLSDYYFTADKLEAYKLSEGRYCVCRCSHYCKQYLCRGNQDTVLWRKTGRSDVCACKQPAWNCKWY